MRPEFLIATTQLRVVGSSRSVPRIRVPGRVAVQRGLGHRCQSARPSRSVSRLRINYWSATEMIASNVSARAASSTAANRLRGHATAMSEGTTTCSLLEARGRMRTCCAGADRAARQVIEGSAGVRSSLRPTRTPANTTKTPSSGREGSTILGRRCPPGPRRLLRSHGSNPPAPRWEHATRPPPGPQSTRQPSATMPRWRS